MSTPRTSKKFSFTKQSSVMSQDQFHFEVNQFSHISLEDLPVVAAPSPYPGRATFAGDDAVSITSSHKVGYLCVIGCSLVMTSIAVGS